MADLKGPVTLDKIGLSDLDALSRNYFEQFKYNAGQRMQCFQFFLTGFAAVATGFAALLGYTASTSTPIGLRLFAVYLGLFALLITLAFARLDRRNTALVRNARSALRLVQHYQGRTLGGWRQLETFELSETREPLTSYGALMPLIYFLCALSWVLCLHLALGRIGIGEAVTNAATAAGIILAYVGCFVRLPAMSAVRYRAEAIA